MGNIRTQWPRWVGALLLSLVSAGTAQATENGDSIYPHGVESFLVGSLPPPGNYIVNDVSYYDAGRVNDGHGHSVAPNFHLQAVAEAIHLLHFTPGPFGSTYGVQMIVPFVHLDLRVAGSHVEKAGLGDITVTPFFFGWHGERWHGVVSTDINAPTGVYNKANLLNIGRNYWEVEPIFAVSYIDPNGPTVNAKFMYDFNQTNPATNYRSGQEFHFDFAAGWILGNWTVGGVGYYDRQTQDDTINGVKVAPDGNRGEVLALGPGVQYLWKGVVMKLLMQHEVYAYNRVQGDKFWFKVAIPF